MTPARHELKVIMFTDLVGYTALMGSDEKEALSVLAKNKEIHKNWLGKFRGKWLKEMGDGILASFESIIDAVYCAGAILSSSAEISNLNLRIGIHLGDVVADGPEIYGDGINIASRIQASAQENQIVISEIVYDNIKNKQGIQYSFLGKKELKNVAEPVPVYSISFAPGVSFSSLASNDHKIVIKPLQWIIVIIIIASVFIIINRYFKEPLGSPDVAEANVIRSIAILPFVNLTGDTSQDYLVEGMQDNLITTISQIRTIDVISRTSTLPYKGKEDKTIPEIARELDVDAIIETSVVRSDDSVRINVQFVQAFPSEKHLWARVFDRPFNNILNLYDDVARAVARDISQTLSYSGSLSKEVNPEAYNAYMNGKFLSENEPSKENLVKALAYFNRAVELDSMFAPAYAGISWVWITRWQMGLSSGTEAVPRIYTFNRKAIELDPDYPEAQYHKAIMTLQSDWDWEKSEKAFKKALELNPSHSMAHAHFAHLLMYRQRWEEAMPHLEMAMRLDPLSPHVMGLCAIVFFHHGDFEKALEITASGPDIFGKWVIEESNAYLNGDYPLSIEMLKARFGADSTIFQPVLNKYNESGYKDAMKQLAQSLEQSGQELAAVGLALYYNRAGLIDDAIRVLDEGYRKHDPNMPYAFLPVELKNLESDPRYRELAGKMNLPY